MVKRYRDYGMLDGPREFGKGEWVDYTDYAALQASHARLLDALKDARQVATFEKHPFRGWHLDADRAIAAAQPFTETSDER